MITQSQPSEIKEPQSVGEEFIEWAERYWQIDKLINPKDPDSFAGEVCDYKYMRKIFLEKIDAIVTDRLGIKK